VVWREPRRSAVGTGCYFTWPKLPWRWQRPQTLDRTPVGFEPAHLRTTGMASHSATPIKRECPHHDITELDGQLNISRLIYKLHWVRIRNIGSPHHNNTELDGQLNIPRLLYELHRFGIRNMGGLHHNNTELVN
jgi:hypothetical protein